MIKQYCKINGKFFHRITAEGNTLQVLIDMLLAVDRKYYVQNYKNFTIRTFGGKLILEFECDFVVEGFVDSGLLKEVIGI